MKPSNDRALLPAGAAAAVVYVFAVLLGGLLRPGYSHISQAVSELIEVGAPNKPILNTLFLVYNALTGVFAAGLLLAGARSEHRRTVGTSAGAILLAEAVVGFATVFFPQDVPGTQMTPTGMTHIALAGLSSLCTMAAILLSALWLRKRKASAGYDVYSWITLAVVFVTGGLAAVTTARGIPINGLAERLTIGAFLQWMFVLGVKLPSDR